MNQLGRVEVIEYEESRLGLKEWLALLTDIELGLLKRGWTSWELIIQQKLVRYGCSLNPIFTIEVLR